MMGEVRVKRTSPLPSPVEAPASGATHRYHSRRPSSSQTAARRAAVSDSDRVPATGDPSSAGAGTTHRRRKSSSSMPSPSSPELPKPGSLSPLTGEQEQALALELEDEQGRRTLQDLRKQMEELLVFQQSQHRPPTVHHDRSSPLRQKSGSAKTMDQVGKQNKFVKPPYPLFSPAPGALSSAIHSDSTGSSGTIRGLDPGLSSNSTSNPTANAGQTPSYPFPETQGTPQSTAAKPASAQDRAAEPMHFKISLPPSNHRRAQTNLSTGSDGHSTFTEMPTPQQAFQPLDAKLVLEDPTYPTPNLYDLTLKLNADPGLDGWWVNVVSIFRHHYGAERLSLAIPGDTTDLENVPWGQKAVFNQNIDEEAAAARADVEDRTPEPSPLPNTSASTESKSGRKRELPPAPPAAAAGARATTPGSLVTIPARPSLLARHSFAGFMNRDGAHATSRRLGRLRSQSGTKEAAAVAVPANAKVSSHAARDDVTGGHSDSDRSSAQQRSQSDASDGCDVAPPQLNFRQAVFRVPQPLETAVDPLIKRTGVVKLFGRTKPVVLTREYASETSASHSGNVLETPDEKVQVTPMVEPNRSTAKGKVPRTRAARSKSSASKTTTTPQVRLTEESPSLEFYDEYEQVPPSPWSQSPAPSPAPRMHADQNPFFSSHSVDEDAFMTDPPPHDYANLEPLEAIGVDTAKSVVHIPLLHSGASREPSPSTLRFPVAIISLLSPIIPYPPNLRQSLAFLMPHLTTSFVLAQQYSQLERQVASRLEAPRYGRLLGLGGTFSDESSELELVAGLSGHVGYGFGDDSSLSARASLSSPGDRSISTKFSPSVSAFGTPAFDPAHGGSTGATLAGESPGVANRNNSNIDAVDSYFNVHQAKGGRDVNNRNRPRLSKSSRQNAASSSTPSSPGMFWGRSSLEEEPASSAHDSTAESRSTTTVGSPAQASHKYSSTTSIYGQLQRELSRPVLDTIAQLMLNSVPLHLFLAKPQTGEVIWTNTKFDAYRRSQPQEKKSRDPWQNVHTSEREHLSQEWETALRTGSQFTERVRVRRFNDESAYRWFIFRANPLLSATGEVLYWIGSFLDIHEQHIAELKAALEREKFATDAKYRAFSNSIPQVVFEAAEYRGIIFVNEQWHLYTGQKLNEALNLGFARHVHPDDLEKCGLISMQMADPHPLASSGSGFASADAAGSAASEKQFDRGVTPALDELVRRGVVSAETDENGRVFYSTEIRLRSKGGDFRWHLVRLVKVETSSFGTGETSWYGTCTDINDRKLLERELNKAMQQLNKEMESKTKFFSNMSHEIRTPLNGILGTIPFMLDTHLDTDQRRMMDTIQNSSTNLRELVDNILDVSRVEAGKMTMVNSWFHVRSVLEDVIDTVSSRAIDKGLEINYLMDVEVPAMVIGDRFRIRQVLINLVGNAVKFTSEGEIYTRCSIRRDPSVTLNKPTEILLNFDVVDTGKGFSDTDATRLMQRFSQIGETGSQHAGSGLGLFLSKQLVEMHGGRLTPSSREGQGAQFSFFVKVDAPPPPSPAEARLIRELSDPPDTLGTLSKSSSLQRVRLSAKELADTSSSTYLHDVSLALESPLPRVGAQVDGMPRSSPRSFMSSALPTPELDFVPRSELPQQHPPPSSYNVSSREEVIRPQPVTTVSQSSIPATVSDSGSASLEAFSPTSYSILIIAPLDRAREALNQHIEQVVPHEVPYTIASFPDLDDWKDSLQGHTPPDYTHVILNLSSVDDLLEAIHFISQFAPGVFDPRVVVVTDLYQKRQFQDRSTGLVDPERPVLTVPKPVKPSSFSAIFDPLNQRELSKDRNQDMAREINNNFRSMSKMVKQVLGNKGYRILLVEDDATNRLVMLKYLDKINVMSETATNGQECTEMVFSKEPGYYSLIICDIQMPIKNGYETCREIRAWEHKNHYPQIPIMALSANAMTEQIENAARAGFNDYVTKPINHNDLGKMMMELLNPNGPPVLLRDRLNPGEDRGGGGAGAGGGSTHR